MLCEIAPLSDQLLKTYCTPAPPDCGEVVAMVCDEPAVQFSMSVAATRVPPSTETRRPTGLVAILICAVAGSHCSTKGPDAADAGDGVCESVTVIITLVEDAVHIPTS